MTLYTILEGVRCCLKNIKEVLVLCQQCKG